MRFIPVAEGATSAWALSARQENFSCASTPAHVASRLVRLSRATSLVLAVCLAALPLAPTPHVHETADHDHHELMVHSHGAAHHLHVQHVEDADADDHGATLDDVDSVVLTLDPVLALPHAFTAIAPPVTAIVKLLEPPVTAAPVLPVVVRPLAHSPPRAPAILRGPPSPSFL